MIELTDSNFQEEVQQHPKFALVFFFGGGCLYCKAMAPIIDNLETKSKFRKIKFCLMDVDENDAVADAYHIKGTPTVILFYAGRVVRRTVGAHEQCTLEDLLGYYLRREIDLKKMFPLEKQEQVNRFNQNITTDTDNVDSIESSKSNDKHNEAIVGNNNH